MWYNITMTQQPMKLSQAAEYVGASPTTLQRWDRQGKLSAQRTGTGRRYYTKDQLDKFLGRAPDDGSHGSVVIYARVSSYEQKDDLSRQVEHLKIRASEMGFDDYVVMTDIGSGMNYRRKNWNKILDPNFQVSFLLITYKDRFVRFGYDWFSDLLKSQGTKIIITDNNPDMSPEQELVDDLISIIQVFSSRVPGLRKYKKEVSGDENQSVQDADQANQGTADIAF